MVLSFRIYAAIHISTFWPCCRREQLIANTRRHSDKHQQSPIRCYHDYDTVSEPGDWKVEYSCSFLMLCYGQFAAYLNAGILITREKRVLQWWSLKARELPVKKINNDTADWSLSLIADIYSKWRVDRKVVDRKLIAVRWESSLAVAANLSMSFLW